MTTLDAFSKHILPSAKGCPAPVLRDNVRLAIIDLCVRSRIWRHEVSGMDVVPGSNMISTPAGSAIHEIESVRQGGKKLCPTNYKTLDEMNPEWRTDGGESARYYLQTTPGSIILVPAITAEIDLTLYLKPSDSATEVPDFFIDQYHDGIAAGALARILAIPGQSFYDPALAGAYAQKFAMWLDSVSHQNQRGQQRAVIKTKSRFM